MRFWLFCFLYLTGIPFLTAQIDTLDNTVKSNELDTLHSPKKAAIFSAVLPGLGQAYNKKYWKIPIVYAALGTSVYFIIDNNKNYNLHRNEYLYRINNSGATGNLDLIDYSETQLLTLTNQYRRWRDLSVVVTAAFYALQIIDATVDAYLWRFDKSDNLSFRFRPTLLNTTQISPGLKFSIKF